MNGLLRSRLHVLALAALFTAARLQAQESGQPLVVVKDFGGVSALPYYRALNIQASTTTQAPQKTPPTNPTRGDEEARTLPIRSTRLTPGDVTARVITAPGLSPIFLIGHDSRSRGWLRQRTDTLRSIHATGFVVQVDTAEELASIRALAPGMTIVPASGDDLARRLGIEHYPVLITATSIEQ